MDAFEELKRAVERVEIVDAHAHNIVALDSTVPFLSCFSGDILPDSPHTLDFKRSLDEICELYGSSLSLDSVQESRERLGLASSAAICFKAARIAALLLDDGIKLDKTLDIKWHESLVPTVGRILQVEHVAEKILDRGSKETSWTLGSFMEIFTTELKSEAEKAVAFKSIVAYRSGLAINTEVTVKEAEEGLNDVLCAGKPIRVTNKSFVDYIFMHALEVAQNYDLPLQIDTGFGDKDLDLRPANPLNLRNLLEDKRLTKNRLVLLHASFPFLKEASYLSSVYSQVYLDFGLTIPKLSFHGMVSSVKEILELAPMNKKENNSKTENNIHIAEKESKEDATATLIYCIAKHFIGEPKLFQDRSLELLNNLRCPKLTDFRWYKDMFIEKVMVREDCNKPFWKERFISGLPRLFAEKFHTVDLNCSILFIPVYVYCSSSLYLHDPIL
ncbi:protein fluG-like [Nicotiana tabacum]|uniref:Protein fluG-like n=1 Tax=Nicotiana tabacum TaxID=4097 RepID=A0AC58T4V2_TOBAC